MRRLILELEFTSPQVEDPVELAQDTYDALCEGMEEAGHPEVRNFVKFNGRATWDWEGVWSPLEEAEAAAS